jgi:hypothetical protein
MHPINSLRLLIGAAGIACAAALIPAASFAAPASAAGASTAGSAASPARMLTSGQSPSHGARFTYDVRADIDGHSVLTLRGRTARWFHTDYAAPGTHNGQNNPTIINGTKWFPRWPQPGQNYFCRCSSSTFRKVTPRVPRNAVSVFVQAVSCRDSCSVRYSDNGTLVIDFNDDPSSSDAWYEVKVTLTT